MSNFFAPRTSSLRTPSVKNRNKPSSVWTNLNSSFKQTIRLHDAILGKPFGWKKTITNAFTCEDAEKSFNKSNPSSNGLEVKHIMLHCNLQGKDRNMCNHPIAMQDGKGTGNTFKHILNYHFGGDEDAVLEAYVDAIGKHANSLTSGPLSKFVSIDLTSPKERAMLTMSSCVLWAICP
jgi:hypothetical protein